MPLADIILGGLALGGNQVVDANRGALGLGEIILRQRYQQQAERDQLRQIAEQDAARTFYRSRFAQANPPPDPYADMEGMTLDAPMGPVQQPPIGGGAAPLPGAGGMGGLEQPPTFPTPRAMNPAYGEWQSTKQAFDMAPPGVQQRYLDPYEDMLNDRMKFSQQQDQLRQRWDGIENQMMREGYDQGDIDHARTQFFAGGGPAAARFLEDSGDLALMGQLPELQGVDTRGATAGGMESFARTKIAASKVKGANPEARAALADDLIRQVGPENINPEWLPIMRQEIAATGRLTSTTASKAIRGQKAQNALSVWLAKQKYTDAQKLHQTAVANYDPEAAAAAVANLQDRERELLDLQAASMGGGRNAVMPPIPTGPPAPRRSYNGPEEWIADNPQRPGESDADYEARYNAETGGGQ